MEVAGLIVDRHLQLLQKRDAKDGARDPVRWRKRMPGGIHPHPRSARAHVQPRADAADRAGCGVCQARGEWIVTMNEEDLPSLRLSQRTVACCAENTDRK